MASPITAPGRAPIRAVAAFTFHGRLRSPARSGPIVLPSSGGVSRVAKGADCKSAALWLRRFESCLPHHLVIARIFEFPETVQRPLGKVRVATGVTPSRTLA